MSTGIKVLPTTVQKVSIANEYAPGFLSSVSSNIIKDPAAVLRDEILGKLGRENISLGGMFGKNKSYVDIDVEIDVTDKGRATSDMAFITFMLSRYHKEHRKNGSAARFAVSVGDAKPIEFFCMKNYTYAGDESYTTDNDIILASILGLNATVKCLRENNMAGMHPLSRTAITEDGVDQLGDYLYDNDRFRSELNLDGNNIKNTAVKLYNTACARKCHQFTGITKYYIPELAAAQLVMGVMSSKSQSSALIDITNRNISKISRAAGTLSRGLMMDFMDFCKPPGSQYDVSEIFNAYKNKSKKRVVTEYDDTVETIQSYRSVPSGSGSRHHSTVSAIPKPVKDEIPKEEIKKLKEVVKQNEKKLNAAKLKAEEDRLRLLAMSSQVSTGSLDDDQENQFTDDA